MCRMLQEEGCEEKASLFSICNGNANPTKSEKEEKLERTRGSRRVSMPFAQAFEDL